MVTFECKDKNCKQANIKIDFMGSVNTAECGGCGILLISFDLREDPELPAPLTFGE